MQLRSNDLQDQRAIDPQFAFGRSDGAGQMALSDNLNPHLAWDEVPEGTQSFALICVDPDVPSVATHVNQEGHVLAEDMPRVNFYHWSMANISAATREIPQGSCSQGVSLGGKQDPQGPAGSIQGANDYTHFMAGSDIAGQYLGYDGPCPPWNDARIHHYHFLVFALDVERLNLEAGFSGQDLLAAIEGHVLAQAELVGHYTLFPAHLAQQAG